LNAQRDIDSVGEDNTTGVLCQMVSAYSAIVRSDENGPMAATLHNALVAQASASL
jgi:hypothetical protein